MRDVIAHWKWLIGLGSVLAAVLVLSLQLHANPQQPTSKDLATMAAPYIECDIWGANILDPLVLNEGGLLAGSYITGPFPEDIEQVWKIGFNAGERQSSFNYCLKHGRTAYSLTAGFHSETEGSFFFFKEHVSEADCKNETFTERVVPLPDRPLSRKCPSLHLGATRQQVQAFFGQASVEHGHALYYLQDDTPLNRKYCKAWLDENYSECCYPGMSLVFAAGVLSQIVIQNGGGEGPPCDENPADLK